VGDFATLIWILILLQVFVPVLQKRILQAKRQFAMRRIEARYGISFSTLWSLRYRPPKDIFVSTYELLRYAYLAEHEKHERLIRHELEITKAKSRIGAAVVRAAASLAGEKD